MSTVCSSITVKDDFGLLSRSAASQSFANAAVPSVRLAKIAPVRGAAERPAHRSRAAARAASWHASQAPGASLSKPPSSPSSPMMVSAPQATAQRAAAAAAADEAAAPAPPRPNAPLAWAPETRATSTSADAAALLICLSVSLACFAHGKLSSSRNSVDPNGGVAIARMRLAREVILRIAPSSAVARLARRLAGSLGAGSTRGTRSGFSPSRLASASSTERVFSASMSTYKHRASDAS